MPLAVEIIDETLGKRPTRNWTLDLNEHVTVREIIRRRVYQEVQDYNLGGSGVFSGLVQPHETEVTLNGYRLKERRRLDWRAQAEEACRAFEQNGFMILVDDGQVTSLDETLWLKEGATVTFLKLVPLVGG